MKKGKGRIATKYRSSQGYKQFSQEQRKGLKEHREIMARVKLQRSLQFRKSAFHDQGKRNQLFDENAFFSRKDGWFVTQYVCKLLADECTYSIYEYNEDKRQHYVRRFVIIRTRILGGSNCTKPCSRILKAKRIQDTLSIPLRKSRRLMRVKTSQRALLLACWWRWHVNNDKDYMHKHQNNLPVCRDCDNLSYSNVIAV